MIEMEPRLSSQEELEGDSKVSRDGFIWTLGCFGGFVGGEIDVNLMKCKWK